MAFLSFPSPPLRACTDGQTFARSYADLITKFSRIDGLPIFLPMVLRWCASRAEAPLLINYWMRLGTIS